MEDYIIDEKLLKDIQEATFIPTPYPQRLEQNSFDTPTSKPQNFQVEKRKLNPPKQKKSCVNTNKDYIELETNFINLTKQYEKIDIKYKNQIDLMKKTKNSYDSLIKEYSLLQKTNESLSKDKLSLEAEITELKAYCRKIESRLVSGAKNQNVIEINNKLRNENEDLVNKVFTLENDRTELLRQNQELNNQIYILNKSSTNVPGQILQLSTCEKETNELKRKYAFLNEQNQNFQNLIVKNDEKIQELTFAKKHLTELLASKEHEIATMKAEKETLVSKFEANDKELSILKENIKNYDNIKKQNEFLTQQIENFKQKTNEINNKENNKLKEELQSTYQKIYIQAEQIKQLETKYKEDSEKYFNENNNLYQEKEKYKLLYTELISKFNSSYQYDSSLLSDPINALSQAKQKNILLLQKLNLLSK